MAKDSASGMVASLCHSSIGLLDLWVACQYALSYRGSAVACYGAVEEAQGRSSDKKAKVITARTS
ncbi:hypothetical protein IG631_19099 [Alternaria alternata]|nr:hypothetical protein IG631_19099 [Alternaria alternata]